MWAVRDDSPVVTEVQGDPVPAVCPQGRCHLPWRTDPEQLTELTAARRQKLTA